MNIFSFFNRRGSAPVARERLQLLLAHERGSGNQPDLIAILREEILAVIGRHVPLDSDRLRVRMERGDQITTLEVEVDIPSHPPIKLALTG